MFFENFSIDMPFAVRITSLSGVHIFHKNKDTKTALPVAEFGRLYSDYNPRFTEVTYRYVRDRGIAEDLVSDSFMAFWEERDRLPEDVNAPAYVMTIVKNKCLNHLKVRLLHLQIEKKLH